MSVRTLSVFLLLLSLSVTPCLGFPQIGPPPTRIPDALDPLRLEVARLRFETRMEDAVARVEEGLRTEPEDGYLLRELTLIRRDQGRLAEFSADLAGEAPTLRPLPATKLAHSFLAGLTEFYRGRSELALDHFEDCLRQEPQWGWPLFFRARLGELGERSAADVDADLVAAWEDSEVAPEIALYVYHTALMRQLEEERIAEIDSWLPEDDALYAHQVAAARTYTRLAESSSGPEAVVTAWKELRSDWGALAGAASAQLGYLVSTLTPPSEARRIAEEQIADGAPGSGWVETRILALSTMGETSELLEELETGKLRGRTHAIAVQSAANVLSAGVLETEAKRAWDENWNDFSYSAYSLALRLAARATEADSVDAEWERAFPEAPLTQRMEALLDTDPLAALALLDSLWAAGSDPGWDPEFRVRALERSGQRSEAERRFSAFEPFRAVVVSQTLTDEADARGEHERAEFWAAKAHAIVDPTFWQYQYVAAGVDNGLTPRLSHWLETSGADPAGPDMQQMRWGVLASLERYDSLRQEVRGASMDGDPEDLLVISNVANVINELEVAEAALERARGRAADWPNFRIAEAELARARGDRERARTIYGALAAEFPGHAPYRLAASATDVIDLGELSATQSGETPDGIDPPDTSTDYILAGLAEADTLTSGETILLREEYVISCERRDLTTRRHHRTVVPTTETGVQANRAMYIPFDPGEGVPVIEVARVVHPDGTVVEVPQSEILVSAIENENSEVDDSRQIVVPFRDLRPGSAADLVCRWQSSSNFGPGVAFSHFFGSENPMGEETVEVRVHSSLVARPRLEEGAIVAWSDLGEEREATVDTVGAAGEWAIYRWTVRDLPPIEGWVDGVHPTEVYPWISFSTFPDWNVALGSYRDGFWERLQGFESLREEAEAVIEGAEDDHARIDSLYAHVVDSVDYMAISFGSGRIIPSTPGEVRDRGYGDCKDMVSYLVALAASIGIESEPVLIGIPPSLQPDPTFVDPSHFDHVIVRFPQAGLFADPTSNLHTAGTTANLAGLRGVALPPEGPVEIVELPGLEAKDHGFASQVDVYPIDESRARFDVSIEYRGELAESGATVEQVIDPPMRDFWIDRVIAFGKTESSERQEWKGGWTSATSYRLEATYVDSAWAPAGSSEAAFRFVTEVADPFLSYPGARDRITPVRVGLPFENEVVLRFHGTAAWEPVASIATTSLEGPFYSGRIRSEQRQVDGEDVVEVQQSFRLERQELSADEYRSFLEDWRRFVAPVNQVYRYRRGLEAEEIERMTAYAEQYPEDVGFVIQAANRILGQDFGGSGANGSERRTVARRILEPVRGVADAGPFPYLILAGIASRDGRYREADEVVEEGIAQYPTDLYLKAIQINLKRELGDPEAEIAAIEQISRLYAGEEFQLRLITLHAAAGDEAETERARARFLALSGDSDPLPLEYARIAGLAQGARCDEALEAIDAAAELMEPEVWAELRASTLLGCNRAGETIDHYEELWEADPTNPSICNNLAWAYALVGSHLERAESLAQSAVILGLDSAAERNTLAVVWTRQGRWKEARELFEEINSTDDRPAIQVVNQYFIGLCEYETGETEAALATWRKALTLGNDPQWTRVVEESLALHDQGRPVAGAVFENLED